MNRTLLALVVVVLVALVSVAAQAQDYYYTNFRFANKDFPLPDAPCFSVHPTMPMVFDGSAWMVYTCADGRTIARRFLHPVDVPHVTSVTPPIAQGCATVQPGADWRCANGGWLPPGR